MRLFLGIYTLFPLSIVSIYMQNLLIQYNTIQYRTQTQKYQQSTEASICPTTQNSHSLLLLLTTVYACDLDKLILSNQKITSTPIIIL